MQDTISKSDTAQSKDRKKIARAMARGMFTESWDSEGATSKQRKEAYKAALPELRKRANKLRRFMARNGLDIVAIPTEK